MSGGRAAIVLAAGASQRMGSPKALLAWRGTTLLEYALAQARLAGVSELVVVLGPATRHLNLAVSSVLNPEPESGRSTSIRLGASALTSHPDAILVQSVDQPVPHTVLDALFSTEADIVIPTYRGHRGHPVCLAGALLGELQEVNEASEGLRAVVRRHTVTEVAVDDESVVWNLNDPSAYQAARVRP